MRVVSFFFCLFFLRMHGWRMFEIFSLKGGERVGILVSLDLLIIEGWIV